MHGGGKIRLRVVFHPYGTMSVDELSFYVPDSPYQPLGFVCPSSSVFLAGLFQGFFYLTSQSLDLQFGEDMQFGIS